MSRTGGKPRHRLSEHFIVLDEKVNSTNKAAICKYCVEYFGYQQALLISKVTNVVNSCLAHLRKCENFASKYSTEEINQILISTTELKKKENLTKRIRQESDFYIDEDNESIQSSIISSSSHSTQRFNNKDQHIFNLLLLRMTVSNGWAFRWIENPETKAFFSWINKNFRLPSRQILSDQILKEATKEVIQAQIITAQQDLQGITVAFDGWKNVIKQKLMGIVFLTSKAEVLIWGIENISLSRERTEEVIAHHEELLKKTKNQNIKVIAFVTDLAAENAAARRRLQLQRRDLLYLPCFAHQTNLCVADIFKSNSDYIKVSIDACTLLSFLNSSTFWLGHFRHEQILAYNNKCPTLIRPGETRWNSYYYCFDSILKSKIALRTFVEKYDKNNTPVELRINQKYLPENIVKILKNENFWINILYLKEILLPFCLCLDKLQKNNARLFEVLHCFGWFMKIIKTCSNIEFRNTMILRLERRWKTWEQPLLLLSFLLHPNYRHEKFSSTTNLNYVGLGQWIIYYYSVWFGKTPNSILQELDMYRRKKYPFNDAAFGNFNGDILSYWEFVASNSQFELPKLACRIFAIAINTASVERLFSSMGFLHSAKRNRLNNDKILSMCQLRGEIHRSHQLARLNRTEKIYNTLVSNSIIRSNEISEIRNLDYESENNESENNESEDDEIENEDMMNRIINEWIEMLNGEEIEDIEQNNIETIVEINQSLDNLLTQIHLCQDKNAKWLLENLFDSGLESPFVKN